MKPLLFLPSIVRSTFVLLLSAIAVLAQSSFTPPGAQTARTAGEWPTYLEAGASPSDQIVTGPSAGAKPLIRSFTGLGTSFTGLEDTRTHSFLAYPAQMSAGVRVATGDVNGDGILDIVTGPGPGAQTHVKVFDGITSAEIRSFFAYTPSFFGGVFVASGDVNGDGLADIITGADAGTAGGHVKVFDGRTGAELRSFFAFPGYSGGVRVGAGDVNDDGFADIIVGTGFGLGHVKVFDGANNALLASFFAYGPSFTGGVFVAAGDLNGDGHIEIITGAGINGHVKAFDGSTLAEVRSFIPFPGFTGEVHVAGGDIDKDRVDDIIVGAGPGAGPHVKIFSGGNSNRLISFRASDPASADGVYVTASPMAAPDPRARAIPQN